MGVQLGNLALMVRIGRIGRSKDAIIQWVVGWREEALLHTNAGEPLRTNTLSDAVLAEGGGMLERPRPCICARRLLDIRNRVAAK